ncbi:MAG: 4-demethylwyosine synthase TYW1 [Candidatus Woesearchaeota archaeon]|nr:MAG: 4-demethylwyosine synthase TYW1 [Candidatus Woesearchaeota archaeon]
MLTEQAKKELERQHYRVVGEHSAVKVCGWTKKMIRGEGGCYKLKFYGIMSHQCLQGTSSISCANRCTFCWRGYKAPVSKEWKWGVDDPEFIIDESVKAHHDLLVGYGGYEKLNKKIYEESKTVKHVALSLTGEPIMYPRFNELIKGFHNKGISTFVVTNGQYPEAIETLEPVTQLYISMDSPNKENMRVVDKPLFPDYWDRFLRSLDAMKQKKFRTTVRLTLIKGINMIEPESYAKLLGRADPDFIEIKAYMWVGESRERLKKENMPFYEDVHAFAQDLKAVLPEYELVTDHKPSRVVLLAKKKFKKSDGWYTWIDFEKFFTLLQEGKEIIAEEFTKRTPQQTMPKIDEATPEIEFWQED